MWEAVGAEERGLIPRAELDELERFACPGAGTCAGHFTANTMAVALDCLGITVLGDGLIPADELDAKGDAAVRAGTLAVSLAAASRTFLDRRALLNAMTGIAATGGSTNGILHLLAIAREADVPLTLDELAEVGARTPVIASLAPSGRYMAEDLHRAGGTATVIRELIRGGLFDGSAPTVTGRTLAEATQDAAAPDGEVVFPVERPFKATGALYALRGNLAPDGSLVKASGTVRRQQRGPARVFDSEEACTDAVRAGIVQARRRARRALRRAGGRPRHARDAERDRLRGRRGARRVRRARHRRPLLGRDARADGRARRARGGTRRPARDRARRRHDHDRRRRRDADARAVDDAELARRLAAWEPPPLPYEHGVFARYRLLVGSASEGAVLRER